MRLPDLSMPEGARVDIIVRAKNGHDLTRDCVASIHANTRPDTYRLIVVDDGSDPPLDVPCDVLVRQRECKGAVTATNLGLQVALADETAAYILVLDNDTRVPEGDVGWLGRMVAELEQDESCAAAGATTNFANPPQHILAAPQTYTHDWESKDGRRGVKENPEVAVFVSFAVLLRKEAVAEVGLWDEQFNPGNYEDTDYALQLRDAGWTVKVARSVYIHHVGHQTFGDRMRELMETNGAKFAAKWGVGRLYDLGFIPKDQLRASL